MKILIVDDDPGTLESLARQLTELGEGEIVGCRRGGDALALIAGAAEGVGLVFCELQMPEMDGVEFVRHLARTAYAGGLVFVSNEEERIVQTVQRLARAHQINVLGALSKPVPVEALREVLSHRSARSTWVPRAARRIYAAAELRRAMMARELVNYYQPKIDLASGRLVGVETLVRWRHPENGLVFPDQFVATAEDYGLIDALTCMVLTAALRDARCWQDAGLQLHVAVNVSMANLARLDLPDLLAQAAEAAAVALPSLVLEVTETRLMQDPLVPLDTLTRLRLKRIGLAIDDFGTGHSSLAKLRDVPFTELKVDRGFVHGVAEDALQRTIFEASLGIAQQLGITTVGEGVEDRRDWDFLRDSGCTLAQGHFIGKPMPAGHLLDWLGSWAQRQEELLH